MRTILIIGGAGTFGARITRLLAETGQFHLVIGGRDLAKAQRVLEYLPDAGIAITKFDRKGDVDAQLAHLAPWAVIDAAGPFQDDGAARYRVPEACIGARIHYIDLADSREFVTGIAALDMAARAARTAVISGASSVPALSAAIVDALAADLTAIAAIDIALSASNRATAGPSVNAAILSYVGQPIRFRDAGAWRLGYGWQCLAWKSFVVSGRRPILRRLVGLCDVPDLDLLPRRYPSARNVIFRAGAELFSQNIALWIMSFVVRCGLLKSLSPLASAFTRLQILSRFMGSECSGMSVSVTGQDRTGRAVRNLWTLLGEDGHGPWVPSFAAVLLVQKLAAGAVPAGAGPAIGLLRESDFGPLFVKFHLFTETTKVDLPAPLYARVLGTAFAQMPKEVRAMHAFIASNRATGRGKVARGRDPLARLLGWLFRFPPAQGDVPVEVIFVIDERGETWIRNFAGHRFRSRLAAEQSGSELVLTEAFGPLTFLFDLIGRESGLKMKIRAWRAFGLPMPRFLAPRIFAHETVVDGHFCFNVGIALPWGPLIVHYTGWLEPYP